VDTLPLPPHPDLDNYRKRAKSLVAAAASNEDDAVHVWAADWLNALAKLRGVEITPFVQGSFDRAVDGLEQGVHRRMSQLAAKGGRLSLADAQFLIARAHSFENWAAFANHIEAITTRDTVDADFEAAADAVVGGDIATLKRLLAQRPELIRARSMREHHVTLLHYVAANGVEDFRQKTPPNGVDVARILLDAGADVDAAADTYDGGWWQTTMNLLVSSAHPAIAGLQSALVDVLVDHGANPDGAANDGSPLMTALAFGYSPAAETLVRRGARVEGIIAAAAMGRLDSVQDMLVDATTLRAGTPLVAPRWLRMSDEPATHIRFALAWACRFARWAVAELMLDRGVDPASTDKDDMTPLHWASANGNLDLMERLIRLGVPLEAENVWNGTVLDSTAHFAAYMPVEGVDYLRVMERLIAAGAKVDVLAPYPPGNAVIDELRRRHAIRAS
jgi:ankyrin repeat protein